MSDFGEIRQLFLYDILTQSKDSVDIQDAVMYKQVTVAMHGRGLRLRGIVKGAEIKTKRQFVIRKNQLLYSRIDARNGAIGIVPPELDGAIVTGDFPAFNIDNDQVIPALLGLLVASEEFAERCREQSRGVTNRQRMKEPAFLSLSIKVPVLIENQQKIMDVVDKVHQARRLHQEIAHELDGFVLALLAKAFRGEL